jgi:hypothetical protein
MKPEVKLINCFARLSSLFCSVLGMISTYRNWKRGYVVYHPNSTIFTRVRIDEENNPTKFKLFCVVFFALNALFFLACVTMLILGPVTRGGR